MANRRWVTGEDYKEGLVLAQLAPGPLAAQLAIYIGWIRAGVLGATAVGLGFVGPSFVMVLLLSAFYVRFSPTRTHALLLGSPAIDAASTSDCPTTDQRGVLRPQGTVCDIGSYERQQ